MTHVFLVSKRDDDIRMFYNGTLSGINDALWDPHFASHTVSNTLRDIEEETFIADRNVGEMYLDLILGKELSMYCGVDIIHMRSEDHQELEGSRQSNWDRQKLEMMGLMDSPCHACQAVLVSREVDLGDRNKKDNLFC